MGCHHGFGRRTISSWKISDYEDVAGGFVSHVSSFNPQFGAGVSVQNLRALDPGGWGLCKHSSGKPRPFRTPV